MWFNDQVRWTTFGAGSIGHSSQTPYASQPIGFLVTRSCRLMLLKKTTGVLCIMMSQVLHAPRVDRSPPKGDLAAKRRAQVPNGSYTASEVS